MKKRLALMSVTLLALLVIASAPAVAGKPSAVGTPARTSQVLEEDERASPSAASDGHPFAPRTSLASMLKADGALDLSPGFSGSLDARL